MIQNSKILLLLWFIVLFGSCKKPNENELKLTTSKNLWCAIPIIALENEYFKDEGVLVEVIITDGGRYCMDAILSNSADVGTVVETNVAYLGFTGNKDIRIIGNVVSSQSLAIVANKTKGINEVKDLNGISLAYAPGMGGELYATKFIEKYNISPQIKKLQPKAIPTSIIAGEVDAVSTWEPYINSIVNRMGEENVTIFRDPEVFTGYMHLACKTGFIENNPGLINKMFSAFQKAELFIKEHPNESQLIIAKYINLDIETIKEIWDYYSFVFNMDRNELLYTVNEVGQIIQRTQEAFFSKKLPDYSTYYTDSLFLGYINEISK